MRGRENPGWGWGEGTVETLITAMGGEVVSCVVHDPLMRPVEATYGILGDNRTAVIEMATASGLTLVPVSERNPLRTTTYGTGELIKTLWSVAAGIS